VTFSTLLFDDFVVAFGSVRPASLRTNPVNHHVEYTRRRQTQKCRVFTAVSLSVYAHDISNWTQLGLPNLTQKCSTMSPGNPFIFGSKVKAKVKTQKRCRRGSLHPCECWLFLVHWDYYDVTSRQYRRGEGIAFSGYLSAAYVLSFVRSSVRSDRSCYHDIS